MKNRLRYVVGSVASLTVPGARYWNERSQVWVEYFSQATDYGTKEQADRVRVGLVLAGNPSAEVRTIEEIICEDAK